MIRRPARLTAVALALALGLALAGPGCSDDGTGDPAAGDAADAGGTPDTSGPEDAPAADTAPGDTGPTPADTSKPDTAPPGPAEPDQDGDGIPDADDLFPADGTLPGSALANVVYAHTAKELWTMNVKTYALELVGSFGWPNDGVINHQMTDIAIDRWGTLYGVAFRNLYTCHPQTAKCTWLGELPDSFNALTLVPRGVLDKDRDVLVAISGGGGWFRLDRSGASFTGTKLGEYGGPYTSSGDAYSILGIGTFASANKVGQAGDVLVVLDPKTGQVVAEVGALTGYNDVYGLAGWTDRAFAFDESGAILVVDTPTGTVVKEIKDTGETWWGAGVKTVLD